jgi:methionine synthase I (cobalamin-dependent)
MAAFFLCVQCGAHSKAELNMNTRPEIVTDDHLFYLDALRDSGEINMFGASQYVAREFGVDKYAARTILNYWMDSKREEIDAAV